jgi:hypothetical protein
MMVGCGGSPSTSTTNNPGSGGGGSGSGGGSGNGGGSASDSASGCSGAGSGYGYNNQNGAITGVWLQSPSPGQNPSHVQVNATAYGPATVTQWTVCLDDQAVYQTNNAASLGIAYKVDSGDVSPILHVTLDTTRIGAFPMTTAHKHTYAVFEIMLCERHFICRYGIGTRAETT